MKVLGIIVLIIFLICLIPIGVDFNFEDDKLRLCAKAGRLKIQLLPKKGGKKSSEPKEKKPKEEKVKKEKKVEKEKPKEKKSIPNLCISKEDIFFLVKKFIYKLGRFNRSFNVERFMFHFIASGNDPYNVAKEFAYVNACLSTLAPICERRFKCREVDVWTDCDFNELIPKIDLGFAIVIRIGAFFVLIFGLLNSAIAMIIRNRFRLFYEKNFDKEAYNDEMEASQKLPNLLAKVDKAKAMFGSKNDENDENNANIERTI